MTLSEKDGRLFYSLWFPLLDYVNEKLKVNPLLKNMAGSQNLDSTEVKKVADVLWENVDLIDQYLETCGGQLPSEHAEIIASWKHRVRGTFVIERHLKKGSIFVSLDDQRVYQVLGIVSTWEEMTMFLPLPRMIKATLLPFRDVIISDGLCFIPSVMIGSGMAHQFKDTYMDAKKRGSLLRSLP